MGVPLSLSCVQIANEENIKEKNEIFVETLASTAFGYGSSALITLFLISNPVGWGSVVLLAAGSTAAGFISGKIFKNVYSANYGQIDLVGGIGVDKVCS